MWNFYKRRRRPFPAVSCESLVSVAISTNSRPFDGSGCLATDDNRSNRKRRRKNIKSKHLNANYISKNEELMAINHITTQQPPRLATKLKPSFTFKNVLIIVSIIIASLVINGDDKKYHANAITTTSNNIADQISSSSSFVSQNHQSAATGSLRHSGHYSLAELCPANRPIPAWKKIDGSVIYLTGSHEFNCTITLQTRLPNQHFIVRFEDLRLSCSDKLRLFDGEINYGQPSIKDYSCRDNMANVQPLRSSGTFLTLSYSPGLHSKATDGFRFVVTAVYDNIAREQCPLDASLCRNDFCISKSLFCDGVNHCLDSSDEFNCLSGAVSGGGGATGSGSTGWFYGDPTGGANGNLTSNDTSIIIYIMLAVVTVFVCVFIIIAIIYCRQDSLNNAVNQHTSHYAQYQHQLAQARGATMMEMPHLHQSSSVMFANPTAFSPHHQAYAAYFQPTPFAAATLDRRHPAVQHAAQQHWQATPAGPRLVQYHPTNLIQQQQPIAAIPVGGVPVGQQFAPTTSTAQQQQPQLIRPQSVTISATTQPNGIMTTQHNILGSQQQQHQQQHQQQQQQQQNNQNQQQQSPF